MKKHYYTFMFVAATIRLTAQIEVVSGGNVGIGTVTPGARLEVQSALSGFPVTSGTSQPFASIRLGNVQTNGVLDIGVNSGSGAWLQYTHQGDLSQAYPLLLNPNGGNVGIGTTSPSQKLEVSGSVKATSFLSSTTTYADFVFKPGYQLPSLAETEVAIQRDGHLPGIPSEAEAKEHGIDLGAMQVKLLQKVEELTLHVIAQEKQLGAQQKELRLQQEDIRALRRQLHGNP
jgi:hypothetical protein